MKKGPLISNVQYAKISYEGLQPACTFMVKQTKKIIKYKIADSYLLSLQETFRVILIRNTGRNKIAVIKNFLYPMFTMYILFVALHRKQLCFALIVAIFAEQMIPH